MLDELEKLAAEPAPAGSGADEPMIVLRHFRMNESRAAFQSASLDRYTDVEMDAVELHDLRGTPTEIAKIKKYDEAEQKVGDALKDMLGGGKDSGDR